MIEPHWNSRSKLHTYSERGLAEFILGSESHPGFQGLCANIAKYFNLPENSGEIRARGIMGGGQVYLSAGSCYVYCLEHGHEISRKLEDAVKMECFDKGYPEPPEITQYEAAQKDAARAQEDALRDQKLAKLEALIVQVGQPQPPSTEKQGILEGIGKTRKHGGSQARTEYIRKLAEKKGCETAEEATNYVIDEIRRLLHDEKRKYVGPFVNAGPDFLSYETGEELEPAEWSKKDILRSFKGYFKSKKQP